MYRKAATGNKFYSERCEGKRVRRKKAKEEWKYSRKSKQRIFKIFRVYPVTCRKHDCVILCRKVCIWYASRQCTFRTHKSLKSQNHNGSSKHNVYRALPTTQI